MESGDARVFSIPLTRWLGACPDGHHYRPVGSDDLRAGRKILKLEIPLNTAVCGAMGNHQDVLTIVRVAEYAQEVVCRGSEKEEVFPIARLLADEIPFLQGSMWGSKWRSGIIGTAFIVED